MHTAGQMTTTSHKVARPHTVRLRVSDDELERLQQIALDEKRTVANVLLLAVLEFLGNRDGR